MDNDSIVWKRLKSGNREALAQLYQRYVRILYSYGKKITRDEKLIEDSIQDLFVDLWQGREKLCELETARFYLFRSLRRRIARSTIRNIYSPVNAEEEYWQGALESHEEALILREEAERTSVYLNHLIQNLSARQEEAILLYFYEDFDYEEIAQMLSINEQSARNLIQRALIKLRTMTTYVRLPVVVFLGSLLSRLSGLLS